MALRFAINGEIPRPGPLDELQKPVVYRDPGVVEFRRGGDLAALARDITGLQAVKVDAAPGAGKSTLLPAALARATGALVMHVVPNPLLALDLHTYCVKTTAEDRRAVPMEIWSNPEQSVPRTGVLYMSSNALIQLIATRGKLSQYGSVTVYLDEAHESDACTFLIRTLGLNLGMARFVQASATFSGSGFRASDTLGKVMQSTFDPQLTPKDWDIDDNSKPWGVGNITNNLVVFVDSRTDARILEDKYSSVGFFVHRLDSRTSEKDFVFAMQQLRDKKGGMVVLLLDYSFRSGFSFEARSIIDTGSVAYANPTPGEVSRMHRLACEFECYQARERGASRLRDTRVRASRPECQYPSQICDIEGVEREAAAYLSRCLGFKPLGLLAATVMSKEDLPEHTALSKLLNGVYPLTYYVYNEKGERRTPSPRGVTRAPSSERREPATPPPRYTEDEDYKSFVAGLGESSELPTVGTYIMVRGVDPKAQSSSVFPTGLRSVRALVGSRDGVYNARALSKDDRRKAISMVQNRYNMLNVEIESIQTVVRECAAMGSVNIPTAVKDEVLHMMDERGRCSAERAELHGLLDVLTFRCEDVVEVAPLKNLIEARVKYYKEKLHLEEDLVSQDEYEKHLRELAVSGVRKGGGRALSYESESYGGGRGRHDIGHVRRLEERGGREKRRDYLEVTRTTGRDGDVHYSAQRVVNVSCAVVRR